MLGGMFKKLKIQNVETVRSDSYRVTATAGKDGELRITVYPDGKMLVMGDGHSGSTQWLQSDLSAQAQEQVLRAVQTFRGRA